MWTDETYSFDDIANNFKLPLLVQVSEGYYTEDEDVSSFSTGDVIMVEQCVTLQKVPAKIARELEDADSQNTKYEILSNEILIPLNYEGKLKVRNETKIYETVQNLAKDFPRHAVVLETVQIPVKEAEFITLPAGSQIKLDRTTPASNTSPSLLIIYTQTSCQVALPFDTAGKFLSLTDDREYTIGELVDRYSLPQMVCFLDKNIMITYKEDLKDCIDKIKDATDPVFQLQNVIQHQVLIGYYKQPDKLGNATTTQERHTTSLVVIPLDSPEMNEVLVTVYKRDTNKSSCEKFLGKNVKTNKRRSMAIAEGLQMELSDRPRLIRLPDAPFAELDESLELDEAPPIPPKRDEKSTVCTLKKPPLPGRPRKANLPPLPDEPKTSDTTKESKSPCAVNGSKKADVTNDGMDDYMIPTSLVSVPPAIALPTKKSKALTRQRSRSNSPSIGAKTREQSDVFNISHSYANFSINQSQDKNKASTLGKLFRGKKKSKKDQEAHKTMTQKKQKDKKVQGQALSFKHDVHVYAEPDDIAKMRCNTTQPDAKSEQVKSVEPLKNVNVQQNSGIDEAYMDMSGLNKQTRLHLNDEVPRQSRPVAHISPQSNTQPPIPKEFRLLSFVEVKERLVNCGMAKFADFCFDEKINGAFLTEMDADTWDSLELSTFQKNKLKMILTGWVPT